MTVSSNNRIQFHYLTGPFSFVQRNAVKAFLLQQLQRGGKEVEAINYIFCDDAYLLQMNQQYLNHDTLTDIITFELSAEAAPLLADIYISIERVRENALFYRTPFYRELRRVIFHGALHLVGFSDKNDKDAKRMRNAEDLWMSQYLVSRNTVSG